MSKDNIGLYTFEELTSKLDNAGLKSKRIADNYRQLDEKTTIHIRKSTSDYAIYATEDMYSKLMVNYQPKNEIFSFNSDGMDKDEINTKIDAYKNERHNCIIFIFNGNKNLHSKVPSYQPHEIIVNTNTILDHVIAIMADIAKGSFGTPPNPGRKSNYKKNLEELYNEIVEFDKKYPEAKTVTAKIRERSIKVRAYVKKRANGECQLCRKPAPFLDKDGEPYLECHHVVPLAANGLDDVTNAVALCPNCHRKMHILGLQEDIAYLKEKAEKI